jgi:3-demethoxyubiquinol 3-hydroxylase
LESAVHRHLEDQLQFLRTRDLELRDLVLSIQAEELSHLHHAEQRITSTGLHARALGGFISRSTDVAIWLSTWGDSTRMTRELAAARGR